MGKNKRRSYEDYATDGKAEANACAVCGCRHSYVEATAKSGEAVRETRRCRNCGAISYVERKTD